MWLVIAADFVLLNAVLYGYCIRHYGTTVGPDRRLFFILSNMALLGSEWKFHTIIHERIVSAGEVLKRIVWLTVWQAVVAYVLMRHVMYWSSAGWMVFEIGTVLFILMVILRLIERSIIKRMRRFGRNTRTVTMVGSDVELRRVYDELVNDPATGYRIMGY